MNLIQRLVLTKGVYNTLASFDGELDKEEANSKKLSENSKAMSLEKAQLESDKRDHKKTVEASQKHAKEAQKLVDERAFAAETIVATANRNFEAMVAEKDRLLTEVKKEIERVKADRADAEVRAVTAYHEGFKDTPEYKDLAHHFMMAGGEQLVKRIVDTHLKWDISFLRHPPNDLPASEDHTVDEVLSSGEPQGTGEAQNFLSTTREGPQCADPLETVG
ncbi:hypothetical protein Adt_45275 [Abeliophyllum distichum]|uniref:Uncharacterized protein n=1 Tax=Abeliophyllum distichum TaxID=126358 RepID=A0ABD1PD86_9LAMI